MFYQNMLETASSCDQWQALLTCEPNYLFGSLGREVGRTGADDDTVGKIVEVVRGDRVGRDDVYVNFDARFCRSMSDGIQRRLVIRAARGNVEDHIDSGGHQQSVAASELSCIAAVNLGRSQYWSRP